MKNIINKILSIFIPEKQYPTLLGLYMDSVTNENWITGMNRTGQIKNYITYK